MMKNIPLVLLALITVDIVAQVRFPDLSPKGTIQQKVGLTIISVVYERPAARGRKVFGELVPYKALWRTGAGNGTKIKFDQEVLIENNRIPSGTYALFCIPDIDEWTVILNSDTTLYGTGGYDERKDVVRIKATSVPSDRHYESFTIDIDVKPDDAILSMSWEKTRVSFEIKTQTEEKIQKMVSEQLISGNIPDAQTLAIGAEYYYMLGRNLDTGLTLVDMALRIKPTSWYYALKTDILTKNEKYAEAIEAVKLNLNYLKSNPENWTKDQYDRVLSDLKIQMKMLEEKIRK